MQFCQILPKTAWNWKNLDAEGGGGRASLTPPLRSATDLWSRLANGDCASRMTPVHSTTWDYNKLCSQNPHSETNTSNHGLLTVATQSWIQALWNPIWVWQKLNSGGSRAAWHSSAIWFSWLIHYGWSYSKIYSMRIQRTHEKQAELTYLYGEWFYLLLNNIILKNIRSKHRLWRSEWHLHCYCFYNFLSNEIL